jgi:CRP-like cAMP-binding protein
VLFRSKLYRATEDGTDTVVAVNGAGQSFGEAAALLGIPAHAGAEAASDARVLTLDAERLRARLAADPDLAFPMLASASMHLRVMVEELEQLKSLPATRRIAGFLADLAGPARGAVEVEFPYEKTLIAGRLGMTPESFSRGLAKLREIGVTVDREKVSIARIETLRRTARGEA